MSVYLVNEYKPIEHKIRNNEYKTFYDYEKDMKRFNIKMLENAPAGPNRHMIILDFTQKATNDASSYFMKILQNDVEITKSIAT